MTDAAPKRPPAPPIWMPTGGRGALLFWGGLCAVLAALLVWSYGGWVSQEKAARLLRDQEQILGAENQQLRAQIDKLQGQLAQEGNLLKSREQVLQAATQTLQAVQAQTEQQGQQSAAARQAQNDLHVALTKAFVSQDGVTVWTEGDAVRVRILDGALFDSTDPGPNKQGAAFLHKLAEVAKEAPAAEILVESYMDTPPAKGKPAAMFNPWDLSLRRGNAVARALAEATDPVRVSLRPYGAAKPLSAADHGKNRRIELTLHPLAK
ncbi:MAG: OmpA family protein [Verrucomicrobium sp.]|nr:OmpA family protein [Verrucomicrobium sp.]